MGPARFGGESRTPGGPRVADTDEAGSDATSAAVRIQIPVEATASLDGTSHTIPISERKETAQVVPSSLLSVGEAVKPGQSLTASFGTILNKAFGLVPKEVPAAAMPVLTMTAQAVAASDILPPWSLLGDRQGLAWHAPCSAHRERPHDVVAVCDERNGGPMTYGWMLALSALSLSAHATDDIPTYELLVEREATVVWPLFAEVAEPEKPEERYAVLAMEELRINDRVAVVEGEELFATIVGNAGSGQTDLGADSFVGDVVSNGPLHLRDRGFIDGTLRAADRVEVQCPRPGETRIRDGVIEGPLFATACIVRSMVPDGPPLVRLEPGDDVTIEPGVYPRIALQPRSTLRLRNGTYTFGSLVAESDAKVVFEVDAGPTVLNIDGEFRFRGRFETAGAVLDRPLAAYVKLTTFTDRDIHIEAPWQGTLVAPNAKVSLQSRPEGHAGAIYARSVEIHQGSTFAFEPFVGGLFDFCD